MRNASRRQILAGVLVGFFLSVSPAEPAEVIIVGDTLLAPVVHIISGMKETLDTSVKVYSPASVKDRLRGIATREEAKVVVALGREALDEALRLPPSIPVIYDLVITPPPVNRPNTTGFFMVTPVREYAVVVRRYLPSLRRIAVVGSADLARSAEIPADSLIESYRVKNTSELVETVRQLDSFDAILLLPDVSLLTSSALEEIYLFSFRKGIPILGISEKSVRQGSLMALVFDPVSVGRNIGEGVSHAIRGADIGRIPPSPPQKFELYINLNTAEKMNIAVPAELAKKARRVYP